MCGYKPTDVHPTKHTKLYRIGYGESEDGSIFKRKDESDQAKVRPSKNKEDWDSVSVTYPYVFTHKKVYYMLYNGNQFGKTGFGIAVWK